MTWSRIRTDPYYTGPDHASGVKPDSIPASKQSQLSASTRIGAPPSTGDPEIDQALAEYRHAVKHGNLSDRMAAAGILKAVTAQRGYGHASPEAVNQAIAEYRHATKYGGLGDRMAASMTLKVVTGQPIQEQGRARAANPPAQSAPPVAATSFQTRDVPYKGVSGTEYKYDLNNPLDRTMYQVDPLSKTMDRVLGPSTPGVNLDRSMGQRGGGIVTK
jgi:hypothetical protein